MSRGARLAGVGACGLLLGFGLSRIGFADWAEVNRMFTLRDFRLYLTFAGGVAILMVCFRLLRGRLQFGTRAFHPGIVPGAALFGIGWAITGACPTIVLVQLAEGHLIALASVAGLISGMRLFRSMQGRLFRWDTGSCET